MAPRSGPIHQARTSVSRPVTAAAAAMVGLIRWVRAPRPWRPTKLRLEVEAQRSPGRDDLAIGAEAHRATGLAPVEAGVREDPVEAFRFRLLLDRPEPGTTQAVTRRAPCALATTGGCGAQILDAAVGA